MRKLAWILAVALAAAAFGVGGTALVRVRPPEPRSEPGPTPRGVRGIVLAQPFAMQQSFPHYWRAEMPQVVGGWLVVLEVDPELVVPRQLAEPVLYVGDQTAERVNVGDVSGRLIAIVPSRLDASGAPELDLARAPIWFGAPDLPERVDARTVGVERARAQAAGIAPLAAQTIASARAGAGPTLVFADRTELERYAAGLVLAWAPEERELAESLLAPLLR